MQERDLGNKHYSEKGGHLESHLFWRHARRLMPGVDMPDKNIVWMIKRTMPRMPKEGKK